MSRFNGEMSKLGGYLVLLNIKNTRRRKELLNPPSREMTRKKPPPRL